MSPKIVDTAKPQGSELLTSQPSSRERLKELLAGLLSELRAEMKQKFKRHVSLQDLLSDRWETARFYGFGEGSSCYNNVLILGDVRVGAHTWIGPNVILDGSGGLTIGDHCDISAGAQLYTHHTVERVTSRGERPVQYAPTTIGSGVYIGPNCVIQMGVTIGDGAVIGAMSFVNRDVPAHSRVAGVPARLLPSKASSVAPAAQALKAEGDEL
jgi:acetyltransferase-like isoleucine patch superfamily enzyme